MEEPDTPARALLAPAPNAPPAAVAAAHAVGALDREDIDLGGLTVSQLADSVTVLARCHNASTYQLARRLQAAAACDAFPVSARSRVTELGWSGRDAAALLDAARFAPFQRGLAELWRTGVIGPEAVAVLFRGTRELTGIQIDSVVAHVLPHVAALSIPALRKWVAMARALLLPQDTEDREQAAYDQRYLAFSDYQGIVSFQGQLPAVEGAAFRAAITALAESLRSEGDGLSRGQRNADALATMVNHASVSHTLPASSNGHPVAATITIGLHEAERVAAGQTRTPAFTLDQAAAGCAGPSRLADLGQDTTLGDAAVRFALCCAPLTGLLVQAGSAGPVAQALAVTRLEPLAVGRSTRLATPAQRKALAVRDGGCIIPGCSRPPAECQTHHVTDWALAGNTDISELALVCWTHHRQADLHRWTLTPNPEPTGPHWLTRPTPRAQWRQRAA